MPAYFSGTWPKAMSFDIRKLDKSCVLELVEVARLAAEGDMHRPEMHGPQMQRPWSAEAFASEFQNKYSQLFGIVENSRSQTLAQISAQTSAQIVGFICYRILLDEIEVLNVAVMPSHQRRGLGRLLLESMFKEGKNAGVIKFHLEVRRSNIKAISLYQSLGFMQKGIRPNYYVNPSEDALLLSRDEQSTAP